MGTEIHLVCEHCGAQVRAPRSVGGQRHSCPQCGNSIYVPTPEDELELLSLADEDQAEVEREKELERERRQLDMQIAHESGEFDAEQFAGSSGSGASSGTAGGGTVESLVLEYLMAMRDADLDKADATMARLKENRKEARALAERLTSDQIPPPAMEKVPPGVYQGFLKSLLSKL